MREDDRLDRERDEVGGIGVRIERRVDKEDEGTKFFEVGEELFNLFL